MSDKQYNLFLRTDQVITTCIKVISYISGICLVGIMLVAFANVMGEKLLTMGVPMATDLIKYLHIPVVFLGAAYVTLDNGHTKIDLLSSRFPQVLQKIFTTFGYLAGAAICAFVSYRGFAQMAKFITRHKMSSTSGLSFQLWPFACILAIGFALLTISFLWAIVRQYAARADSAIPSQPESTEEEKVLLEEQEDNI